MDTRQRSGNGNGNHELPPDRLKAVESGLLHYQQVQAERDLLREELARAEQRIVKLETQVEAMQSMSTLLESRVHEAVLERDLAVAHRTAWEALFISIQAQLKAFQVPTEPLVQQVEE